VKEYFFFLLIARDGNARRVFFALDLLLFYVFWELMLIPMYFIIGVWGGARGASTRRSSSSSTRSARAC